MDFTELVSSTQRADGFVNATKWCKEFGYRLADWKRLPETKKRAKALQEKLFEFNGGKIPSLITVEGSGRNATTWVHPIMAIHLAQYLSPEFANFVAEVFQRYLEADITLADDIVQRQDDPERVKWLKERIEGKLARFYFTDVLKRHGVGEVNRGRYRENGYALCTEAINKTLFGKTAKQIREERQVQETRDGLSRVELAALNLAETIAAEEIREGDRRGNRQCRDSCQDAASRVRRVFD